MTGDIRDVSNDRAISQLYDIDEVPAHLVAGDRGTINLHTQDLLVDFGYECFLNPMCQGQFRLDSYCLPALSLYEEEEEDTCKHAEGQDPNRRNPYARFDRGMNL